MMRVKLVIIIRNAGATESAVIASATPIVMRLPYIMRVSMSRPIWSAPNTILTEGSSQVPPTLADSA